MRELCPGDGRKCSSVDCSETYCRMLSEGQAHPSAELPPADPAAARDKRDAARWREFEGLEAHCYPDPASPSSAVPLVEKIEELQRAVPPEEWDKLPLSSEGQTFEQWWAGAGFKQYHAVGGETVARAAWIASKSHATSSVPEGWSIWRTAHTIETFAVKSPDGYTAFASVVEGNPGCVLAKLAKALIGASATRRSDGKA